MVRKRAAVVVGERVHGGIFAGQQPRLPRGRRQIGQLPMRAQALDSLARDNAFYSHMVSSTRKKMAESRLHQWEPALGRNLPSVDT